MRAIHIALLVFLFALSAFSTTIKVSNMELLYPITGAGANPPTEAVGIDGTDLGIIYEMPNKQIGFLFGDTFGAVGWISNSMAVVDPSTDDWKQQLTVDYWITNPNGMAKELVPGLHQDNVEMTIIPNGALGFPSEGTIYMQYMSVKHWGTAGIWYTNNSSFAISKDNGQNWSKLDSTFIFSSSSKFAQTSMTSDSSYIYLLGTAAGRVGPIYLARVPSTGSGSNLVTQSAYQYLTSTPSDPNHPVWGSSETDAAILINTVAGETSVAWNPYVNQWVVMYFNADKYQIELRTATNIWGPWTDPAVVATGQNYPQLYGGYMLTNFMEAIGSDDKSGKNGTEASTQSLIYFTMSLYAQYESFWCSLVLTVTE